MQFLADIKNKSQLTVYYMHLPEEDVYVQKEHLGVNQ